MALHLSVLLLRVWLGRDTGGGGAAQEGYVGQHRYCFVLGQRVGGLGAELGGCWEGAPGRPRPPRGAGGSHRHPSPVAVGIVKADTRGEAARGAGACLCAVRAPPSPKRRKSSVNPRWTGRGWRAEGAAVLRAGRLAHLDPDRPSPRSARLGLRKMRRKTFVGGGGRDREGDPSAGPAPNGYAWLGSRTLQTQKEVPTPAPGPKRREDAALNLGRGRGGGGGGTG